jgi:hypothetical protein
MRGMGCTLYIRCALSIHKNECRKSLGCALYIGARYLQENTVYFMLKLLTTMLLFILCQVIQERKALRAQRQTESHSSTEDAALGWSIILLYRVIKNSLYRTKTRKNILKIFSHLP